MRNAMPGRVLPVISLVCASGALAQEAARPPGGEATQPPVEEIVVTGSRIRQDEKGFANPVTTFSADSIQQSG
ncbi:MAG TPA: hypothetical protein VFZ95_04995, partial [Steroidobacteraceae bacterium]